MSIRMVAAIVLVLVVRTTCCAAEGHVFFHENVLGTSMELRIDAESQQSAKDAEAVALQEIERLGKVLSGYDSTSELARFLSSPIGSEVVVSKELFSILQLCEQWNHASRNAFNPAVEKLSRLWIESAKKGRPPTEKEIAMARQVTDQPHWELDALRRTARRLDACPLSFNAIAKGAILDDVAVRLLNDCSGVQGVMINVGGDIRVAGQTKAAIAIANPQIDAIAGPPLHRLTLSHGAVATSGSSERTVKIGDESYSHLIDPRTGSPVDTRVGATVIAPDASTADALATICTVLSVNEGLSLVNSIPGVECLLFSAAGLVVASDNFPGARDGDASTKVPSVEKATGHEMLVEFEINNPRQSRRYRRPYVAVWIEDKDKYPVRTLSLFLMQNNPGPRWYRDLRRWYSGDQMRMLVDPTDTIETVSKPTRNPGKYKVKWDGRDSEGKLLKEGKYTLLIEAAREHGTYQLIKQEFEFGKPLTKQLRGNDEIASASVAYSIGK